MEEQKYRSNFRNLIAWPIIILLLYAVNLENTVLYHTLMELFYVLVAYIVFYTIWKSEDFISNKYLTFIGIAYFFIGSYELLHTLNFKGLALQGYDPNISIQLYLIARYLESTAFLIAALLLIFSNYSELNDLIILRNSQFKRKTFITYTLITTCLLISVIYFKNFPNCYILGSGDTPFNEISEYLITFTLICSLILLYVQRDRFEKKVLELLLMSIIFSLMGELPYLTYSFMDEIPRFIGLVFKTVSVFYLYKAYEEAGFKLPFNFILGKIRQEDFFKQEAVFLATEQNRIYNLFGDKENTIEKTVMKNSHESEGDYRLFFQNFCGIQFQMDKDFLPILIEGPIEEITGYCKEEFLSRKIKWKDIIIPEDLPAISIEFERIESNLKNNFEEEYRIEKKNGEIIWVIEQFNLINGDKEKFQGSIRDITKRKNIEETLRKHEQARLKEIHHRIKNNLQVISSLLDLQAEKFSDNKVCDNSKVIEAFRESQNRVISMALIHEELFESKDMVTLNFASYLQKLATDILYSHSIKNQINLKLNLKQIYLGMDTAIPVGIIVNELVSNSIKHAFPAACVEDEIQINLCEFENSDVKGDNSNFDEDCIKKDSYQYMLEVSDNGIGIPKEVDIENSNSLGLQLVNILVEQIDGCLEVKNDKGTKFTIWFNNIETDQTFTN